MAQKLAAIELGAFEYANGLTDHAPGGRYDFGVPPGLDDLRDHISRTAMLNAVPDFMPLPWLETLQRVAALPTLDPIEWLIAAVAFANNLGWPLAPELYEAIGRAYLDRLCAACALSIDRARNRILPPSVLVTGAGAVVPALAPLRTNHSCRRRQPRRDVLPRIREIANERRRFGYRRLAILLRREGKGMNLKKVYRLYREKRLTVRKRSGRKRALGTRAPMAIPQELNQRWSLDFVSDSLACGRRFRMRGRHRRLQPRMPSLHRRHLAGGSADPSRAERYRRAWRAAVHGC